MVLDIQEENEVSPDTEAAEQIETEEKTSIKEHFQKGWGWLKAFILMKGLKFLIPVIVLIGTSLFFTPQMLALKYQLRNAQDQIVTQGLFIDSMEVAEDSLTNLTRQLEEQLGIELGEKQILQNRVLQANIARDRVDAQLNRQRLLNGQLEASVDELETTLEAVTQEEGENRVADFHQYLKPYTVDLSVSLPPPPQMGTAEVNVLLDPIELAVRVQCGEKSSTSNIRPAYVLWETDNWLTIENVNVTQDPEVCNPIIPRRPFIQSWKGGVLTSLITLGAALMIF